MDLSIHSNRTDTSEVDFWGVFNPCRYGQDTGKSMPRGPVPSFTAEAMRPEGFAAKANLPLSRGELAAPDNRHANWRIYA
jgi:hypothetical protein